MTGSDAVELTARLDLRPTVLGDAPEMFAITSDARTWEHAPDGRHQDIATTQRWIRGSAAKWASDGLSYWTIRDREHGVVIGVGGVQLRPTGHWNLFYRFAPSAWGQGHATELGRAGIAAAARHGSDVPVIAWILEHNSASIAVARRLALTDQGPHVDPSDTIVRHAFTDRPVDFV